MTIKRIPRSLCYRKTSLNNAGETFEMDTCKYGAAELVGDFRSLVTPEMRMLNTKSTGGSTRSALLTPLTDLVLPSVSQYGLIIKQDKRQSRQ